MKKEIPLVKLKSMSDAEKAQLNNLNFLASGHMSKSAHNKRHRLISKRVKITEFNYYQRLRNFCINLHNGEFVESEYFSLSDNMDMYKTAEIRHWDLNIYDESKRTHLLKQFIRYVIPKGYTTLFHRNEHLITNNKLCQTTN